MTINADWHAKNRMPKKPTLEQRITWHLAHAKTATVDHLVARFLMR